MPFNEFLQSDFMVRYLLYAGLGLIGETLFTATMDLIFPKFLCSWNIHTNKKPTQTRPEWREPMNTRLTGYSFLWMLPIYGLLVFMEPLSYYLQDLPFVLRGLIYALAITVMEFIVGWLLEKITGRCPWDYSYHKLSIKGYTRYDFIVIWFVVGLTVEHFAPALIKLTPHILEVF
jgi:hypothetical protein